MRACHRARTRRAKLNSSFIYSHHYYIYWLLLLYTSVHLLFFPSPLPHKRSHRQNAMIVHIFIYAHFRNKRIQATTTTTYTSRFELLSVAAHSHQKYNDDFVDIFWLRSRLTFISSVLCLFVCLLSVWVQVGR